MGVFVVIFCKKVNRKFAAFDPLGNDVKAFAQFGTEGLDQATQALLNQGEKLTELLKQGQFSPLNLGEQVVSLFSASKILDIPTSDVQRFEEELIAYVRDGHPDIISTIDETQELSEELEDKLSGIIDTFKAGFTASE